jgi:hypothetical protein
LIKLIAGVVLVEGDRVGVGLCGTTGKFAKGSTLIFGNWRSLSNSPRPPDMPNRGGPQAKSDVEFP